MKPDPRAVASMPAWISANIVAAATSMPGIHHPIDSVPAHSCTASSAASPSAAMSAVGAAPNRRREIAMYTTHAPHSAIAVR